MHRFLSLILLAGALLAVAACSSRPDRNSAPSFDTIPDQVVAVNTELSVTLRATDIDNDPLRFGFNADSDDITARGSIESQGKGVAVFKWTPLASDVGIHAFDFTVNDGKVTTRQTVSVDVRAATSGTAPVFRQPLGTGTTLDLTANKCVIVPIEIEDADSPGVTIGEEPPLIDGATLGQDTGLTGAWEWCPSDAQISGDDIYTLTLSADDGDNPKVLKTFLIVLRKPTKPGCPGTPPVVQHASMDHSTVVDIPITATVTDDLGVKFPPQLLYSMTNPGTPPDVGQMTQLTMKQDSGDARNGSWSAAIPNPVATQPPGASAMVYYVIAAQDDDDPEGDCDHLTQVPDKGTFVINVTNPGGGGGLGLCEECTADAQCGGAGDTCIRIGTMGKSFCGKACAGAAECGADYDCSPSEITSVDGAFSRQCVPKSQTCGEPPPPVCNDDSLEDNDSRDAVMSASPLPEGTLNAVSCLADFIDDEDWYPIDISGDRELTATLTGTSASDLDLSLVDSTGSVVKSSTTLGSNESITQCVSAGRYYLRVYAFGDTAENAYSLTWSSNTNNCGPPPMCMDDSDEDDDNATQARFVATLSTPYTSLTNAICANDEDWFDVLLFNGDKLHVTLTFEQQSFDEDLDILLYKGSGGATLLTQCTEADASGCDINNGQSNNSNEVMVMDITETDTYYVVARGFFGSENLYDICIGLSATDCPPP